MIVPQQPQQILTIPAAFTPRWYQEELFYALDGEEGKPETKKRRVLLRWHRRSGKDLACFCYMIKEAWRQVGTYYYFFPTYSQGRKALWERIDRGTGKRIIDQIPAQCIERQPNLEMLLELKNGSIIRIVGGDNMDSIVGTDPIGIVISEWSLCDPAVWSAMSPVLAENGGWCIFNGTPRGRNHMYKMEMSFTKSPRWYMSVLDCKQSGLEEKLKDAIEEDRLIEGDDFVDQEYYVKYSAGVRGAIFMTGIENARKDGRIGTFIYDPNYPVDTFWDLGKNDMTAIWFRQSIGNTIVWIDYYESNNKVMKEYVEILYSKGYNYRTHYLPHDGGNENVVVEHTPQTALQAGLRNSNLKEDVVVTKKFLRKIDGINVARSRMPRMFWNEGTCLEGIEKLELYHFRWDSKRSVFIKEPVHNEASHCADAFMTEASAAKFDDRDNPFYKSNVPTVMYDNDDHDYD